MSNIHAHRKRKISTLPTSVVQFSAPNITPISYANRLIEHHCRFVATNNTGQLVERWLIKRACRPGKLSPMSPSISARGTSATESMKQSDQQLDRPKSQIRNACHYQAGLAVSISPNCWHSWSAFSVNKVAVPPRFFDILHRVQSPTPSSPTIPNQLLIRAEYHHPVERNGPTSKLFLTLAVDLPSFMIESPTNCLSISSSAVTQSFCSCQVGAGCAFPTVSFHLLLAILCGPPPLRCSVLKFY